MVEPVLDLLAGLGEGLVELGLGNRKGVDDLLPDRSLRGGMGRIVWIQRVVRVEQDCIRQAGESLGVLDFHLA